MSAPLINGMHHTAISVSDMKTALAFYVDLLGLELAWRHDWSGAKKLDDIFDLEGSAGQIVMLRAGNAFIELYQFDAPASAPQDPRRPVNERGYTHVAFDVPDVDRAYEVLSAAGVRFHSKVQTGGGAKMVYGRDPFGNVFELQEVTDPKLVPAIPRTA
jgi:catechol 2,3-dioxygenase-like lactoylglutathione lyase family enzyme